jgi:hypothetical protein
MNSKLSKAERIIKASARKFADGEMQVLKLTSGTTQNKKLIAAREISNNLHACA